ncbi:MAG: hypothetical protein C0591_03195 [Marinilabiliales bacterium]|nr:MAG: hypothetical protein C0591_03195 [Marinilabiliales bacterium]
MNCCICGNQVDEPAGIGNTICQRCEVNISKIEPTDIAPYLWATVYVLTLLAVLMFGICTWPWGQFFAP